MGGRSLTELEDAVDDASAARYCSVVVAAEEAVCSSGGCNVLLCYCAIVQGGCGGAESRGDPGGSGHISEKFRNNIGNGLRPTCLSVTTHRPRLRFVCARTTELPKQL